MQREIFVCLGRVLAFSLAVELPVAAQSSTTYYLNTSEASSSASCWTTPGKWSTSYTADDGVHPDAFTANDDFVVPPQSSGFELRTPQSDTVAQRWTGKSLRIGGTECAKSKTSVAILRQTCRTLNAPVVFENDGLILAGQSRYLPYRSGVNVVQGRVTVMGDVECPADIRSSQIDGVTLVMEGEFCGESDAFAFVDSSRTNFVLTLKDPTRYAGTLVVTNYTSGVRTGSKTRLELANSCPGSIALHMDTALLLDADVTIGNLSLSGDAFVDLGANTLTLTGCFVRGLNPVKVVVDPSLFPGSADVIKGPKGCISPFDFVFVDSNGVSLDLDDVSLVTTETGVAIRLLKYPLAQLLVSDNSSRTKEYESSMTNSEHWTNAEFWQDSRTMPSGWHYVVRKEANFGSILRTAYEGTITKPEGDVVFPGEKLTIADGASVLVFNPAFFCKHLVLDNGTIQPSIYKDSTFTGKITINDKGGSICQYSAPLCKIQSEIVGSGELEVCGVKGAQTSDGYSFFELAGLNTNFTGSIRATTPIYMSEAQNKITPRFDRNYVHLKISDKRNLGGSLDVMNPKALILENMARLELSDSCDSLVLDEPTRGVFIRWVGRFLVDEGKMVTIASPLAVHGTMWKEGSGLLVLKNPAPTFGADATVSEPDSDATNHQFVVSGGDLKIAAVDAVNGLNVVFTNGSGRLIVDLDAQSDDFATYGVRNVKTDEPFAVSGTDGMELELASSVIPVAECEKSLLTVKSSAYARTVGLIKRVRKPDAYKGWSVTLSPRDNGDQTTTLIATIKRTGLILIFR